MYSVGEAGTSILQLQFDLVQVRLGFFGDESGRCGDHLQSRYRAIGFCYVCLPAVFVLLDVISLSPIPFFTQELFRLPPNLGAFPGTWAECLLNDRDFPCVGITDSRLRFLFYSV